MTEIEFKILASPEAAAAAVAAPALAEVAEGAPQTRRLSSRYFDTPDGALAGAGIALRLRRDGAGWVQTVKGARVQSGGLSETTEAECTVSGPKPDLAAIPDAPLRETVSALVGRAALVEPHGSEITRTTRRLVLPGRGVVEMAVDRGEIRAGEQATDLTEIEFELIEGSPAAVFEAVRRVIAPEAQVPSTLSKAERGVALATQGTIFPAPAPRKARRVALEPEMTTEVAAHAVLGECLAQISENMAVVAASDDPEGPHQLRVGLRRLRTALALFSGALAGEGRTRLSGEAKWLGREVGRLRDLDVALADLVRPAAAARPGEPGFARLEAALVERGGAERSALRATLVGARARTFLLDLSEYVSCRGWLDAQDWSQTARLARPVTETAGVALDTRLAKAAKRAKGIEHLSVEARHELRKELKKLRYTAEFCASLYPPKRVKPFLKRLKALQEVFGDLNDAAMAEALLSGPDAPGGDDPGAARAGGFVLGLHAERARHGWERAKGLWRALRDTDPFWR